VLVVTPTADGNSVDVDYDASNARLDAWAGRHGVPAVRAHVGPGSRLCVLRRHARVCSMARRMWDSVQSRQFCAAAVTPRLQNVAACTICRTAEAPLRSRCDVAIEQRVIEQPVQLCKAS